MAITISGQNNNDKILASDGVLDSISGFNVVGVLTTGSLDVTNFDANHINVGSSIQLGNAGIITATTLIGNVTGNVNSTSNLLFQISGSEKFRVGNGGQFGIGGANYGSSGQVFTSAGSGSAPTWSTIPTQVSIANNADNRVITGGSDVNLNGEANLIFDGTKLGIGGNPDVDFHIKSAAPTIRFTDTDTNRFSQIYAVDGNLRFDADNNNAQADTNISFRTDNSERLRISSDGAIGLGGANYGSSGQVLTSQGSGSAVVWSTISGTTINNNAANRIITGSGSANTLNGNTYATWNGNNFALRGGEGQNCTVELASDEGDDNADFWRMMAQASDNALAIDHYATGSWVEQLRIRSDGNVVIGTDSYAYTKPLNVQGSTGAILSLSNYDTTSYAADTNTSIELRVNTGNTGNQNGACEIRAFKENGTNGNNARGLSFYTASNGASPAKRVVIHPEGWVEKTNQLSLARYGNSNLSIPNNSETLLSHFGGSAYETGGGNSYWDTSNHRFTAPVAGMYMAYCKINLNTNTGWGHDAFLAVRKNGSKSWFTGAGSDPWYDLLGANSEYYRGLYVFVNVPCAKNDYIDFLVRQNSGGTRTLYGSMSYFNIYYLG